MRFSASKASRAIHRIPAVFIVPVFFVTFFALSLAACDVVPGVRDLSDAPPIVSSLQFVPQVIDVSQVDPVDLADGEIDVSLNLTVAVASGASDDIDSVYFVVRPPLRSGTPVATGTLLPTSGGRFEATRMLKLPVGQPGNYTIVVYAADQLGQLSNQVQGNLFLDASNAPGSPPIVELVEAFPEEITPPATLVIVATVSDVDGLANILRVEITTPNNQTFNMVDDGESLGDAAAGDGKWTAGFDVPAGVATGTQIFKIQAFDRNGNQSAVVERPVTIR